MTQQTNLTSTIAEANDGDLLHLETSGSTFPDVNMFSGVVCFFSVQWQSGEV